MSLAAVILAAGEGKRMKSALAKPLHRVCGRTLIAHVLQYVRDQEPERVVVVLGVGREMMEQALAGEGVETAIQHEQRGTGHAVMAAAPALAGFEGELLVTCADIPLIRPKTLAALREEHHRRGATATVLTAVYADPTGYGRLVRDEAGLVKAIVEHRDADEAVRAVREINAGVYLFDCPKLLAALGRLRPDNAQGEYYLTDVVADLVGRGEVVAAMTADDPAEVMGINNRVQLAEAEQQARRRLCEGLMLAGATLIDPATTYVEAEVTVGPDTIIWPGVVLTGRTEIGANCVLGPGVELHDMTVGDGCEIRHDSCLTNSLLESNVTVGPFAYIRPDCRIGEGARVGAHTEIVRATLGPGVRNSHFGYLGDAEVGAGTNIGAGTITCNFDGRAKHRTVIGEGAFIGSDAVLVAPVSVGRGAYVGAGSVITKEVPEEALGLGRSKQENLEGWARRRRGATDDGGET